VRIKTPRFDVKAVSFDLDDTLWPVQPILSAAEDRLYALLETDYPAITATCDQAGLQARRMAFFRPRTELHHDLTRLRQLYFQDLLAEFGYTSGADTLLDHFLTWRNDVTPYPGCVDFLTQLAERFPLVACTNGNADVFKTPLAPFFTASVRSEEAGVAKPDPHIFKLTCQAASVRAADLAHVGDNTVTDVIGSQQFGCHGVWYNPDGLDWPHPNEPAPHANVANYEELLALLLKD